MSNSPQLAAVPGSPGPRFDASARRAGFVAMSAGLALTAPLVLTAADLVTLMQLTSVVAIIAGGMTRGIIASEIDLSVGVPVGLLGARAVWRTIPRGR